jgi:23S rRNA (pseudouridine1915-N3)-methyltransferase
MLDITIISVGAIKEKYWQQAIVEYQKRMKPYARLKTVEIPEERVVSVADRQKILKTEGAKIQKLLGQTDTIIVLDSLGRQFSSTDWSRALLDWAKFGRKIVFVIGGPLGLSGDIMRRANMLVSLSKMTFTHQMARVILLEQIYRGITIDRGIDYHY